MPDRVRGDITNVRVWRESREWAWDEGNLSAARFLKYYMIGQNLLSLDTAL